MALTQVKSDGIADGAVTADQIAANAVTVDDISDGSIHTAKLADDAVTAAKLANTAVTAGTYGSSSAIPSITVDAQGRVTSASTSSIDSTAITNGTSNVSVAASGDITVTRGGSTAATFDSAGVFLADNKKIRFGDSASADLEIYHDGSNSAINDKGTGNLYIQGSNSINIRDYDTGENHITCTQNGAVNVFHNGSAKLTTTSTGIDVTGTVTCDGLVCEGEATVTASTGILNIKDSDSSGNATHNFIRGQNSSGAARWAIGQVSTGNEALYMQNNADAGIVFGTNGVNRVLIQNDGHLRANANNTYDLGTSSLRWRNVYTNDLNLSNEGSANDVDGTWGSWTIQEGEDDLFLLNRRNGKKYKFNLTEVN